MTRRVCLGAFAGAHGVKGAAKVRAFTASEDGVAAYGPVESEDGARRFTLDFIRVLRPGLAIVRAPEITSREDAAALAGVRFYVPRAALPPAEGDDFYMEDLVGLAVVDAAGAAQGRIAGVHNFGAGDILEIAGRPGHPASFFAPFTRAAFPSIDLARGVAVIAAEALGGEDDGALVAEAMRQEDA
jgi:16S rRNA processing protein RimM